MDGGGFQPLGDLVGALGMGALQERGEDFGGGEGFFASRGVEVVGAAVVGLAECPQSKGLLVVAAEAEEGGFVGGVEEVADPVEGGVVPEVVGGPGAHGV